MLERLEGVLGVWQKLLATKSTDAHACRLLGVVFTAFDAPEVQAYLTPIFGLCLTRLQSNRAVGKSLVAGWSIFVARYGAPALRAQLEAAQAGLTAMLLTGVWAVHLPNVVGTLPRKTAAIATCSPQRLPGGRRRRAHLRRHPRRPRLLLLADGGAEARGVRRRRRRRRRPRRQRRARRRRRRRRLPGCVRAAHASTAEADLYASETPQAAFRQCLEAVGRAAPGMLPAALQQIGAALPAEQQALQGLMQGVQIGAEASVLRGGRASPNTPGGGKK